jgi:lipopolysaccharide export system permease protein
MNMKILTRYIIKEHIGPFFFALAVILFILLMNFLVKYIGQIFGKGLSTYIILKLIVLNMAWMLALAVPMATLVAVLMAYGRLSADNEITILKSSGISIFKIMRPSLYLGIGLTLVMIYFNDQVLPDTNHQAKVLFNAIREKKPTLQLEEHIFYEIDKFIFVVDHIEKPLAQEWLDVSNLLGPEYSGKTETDRLREITIFDRSDMAKDVTIIAREGYMIYSTERRGIIFTLFDGEFHEFDNNKPEEYQRSQFSKHVVNIPAEEFMFEEKQDEYRSDREMNIKMMRERITGFRQQSDMQYKKTAENIAGNFRYLNQLIAKLQSDSLRLNYDSLRAIKYSENEWSKARANARRTAERYEQQLLTYRSMIEGHDRSINKFLVEIHKKFSIPFASIVFVLIGAPLGIMARKGNMGVAISMSIGFFMLYWIFLIGGEDLADRRFLTPFFAMWAPNIIVGVGGLYLTWRAVKESSVIHWERLGRFFRFTWLRKSGRRADDPESTSQP